MRNFNQGSSFGNRGGGRSGGRGGFGGGSRGGFGGGRDRERPQMHSAVCADCGNRCEVPFKPTGDKPVYCSDCFGGNDRSGGRDSGRRDSGRRDFGGRDSGRRGGDNERQMHSAVCEACGDPCEVPFRPTGEKPVYCSHCFGGNEKSSSPKKADISSEKIDQLNAKLDKIITLLQRTTPVKEVTVMKSKEEAKEAPKKETVSKTETAKKTPVKKAAVKKASVKKEASPKKAVKKAPAKKAAPKKK